MCPLLRDSVNISQGSVPAQLWSGGLSRLYYNVSLVCYYYRQWRRRREGQCPQNFSLLEILSLSEIFFPKIQNLELKIPMPGDFRSRIEISRTQCVPLV